MAKILFIGDVVGKPGRKVLREVLPQWKEEFKPDAVIVNVENLAHGKGMTINTMAELDDLGIDAYTGGNHSMQKKDQLEAVFEKYPNLLRPANFEGNFPGYGYYRFSKSGQQYLVLNFNARVFMEKQFEGVISNPFFALDKMLVDQSQKGDIIIVDFHSEATSEKVAFGWYADGRVSAVLGTHTHIPTADGRVLPKGTAYLSDAGMTGAVHSVIGAKIESSLNLFLEKGRFVMDLEEQGPLAINGAVIETENSKAKHIQQIHKEILG